MFEKNGYHFLKPIDVFWNSKFLVFVDVDNTLTSGLSAWDHLHHAFDTVEQAKVHTELFYAGKIDYERWAQLDVELWKGRHINEVRKALSTINTRPGAKTAIKRLQEKGAFVVLISGGLVALVERLAREISADAFIANDFLLDQKGRIIGPSPKYVSMEKDKIAKSLLSLLNGKPRIPTIAIGDSVNDTSLFNWADFSIAFNPTHDSVGDAASAIVKGEDFYLAVKPALEFMEKHLLTDLYRREI